MAHATDVHDGAGSSNDHPPGSASDRPFARSIVRGTAAAGFATVWMIVISLVAVPFQLRGLGAAGFGAWVLVQTFSAFRGWTALLDCGSGVSVSKLVAEESSLGQRTRSGSVAATGLAISFAGGLVGAAILLVTSQMGLGSWLGIDGVVASAFATAAAWYALAVPIDLVNRSTQFTLEGLQRVELSRLLEIIRRTGAVGVTTVVAIVSKDVAAVGLAYFVVSVPAAALSLLVLRSQLSLARPTRASLVDVARYGAKVSALRPLGTMHRMMDRIVVGILLGPEAVALVEVVTLVQSGAQSVIAACSHAITPSAAWLRVRGDVASQRALVARGTLFTVLAVMPFVVVPALAAPELLRLWLGSDSMQAAVYVPIAVAFPAVAALAQVSSEFLVGIGRPGVVIRGAAAALLANLALTLILVPWLGVGGAFVSSLLSMPLASGPIVFAVLRSTETSVRSFVLDVVAPAVRPTVVLAACTVVVVAAPFSDLTTVALVSIVGGGSYAAIVALRLDLASLLAKKPSAA